MNNIPQIIKEIGFDFDWDNKKVWALDIPVEGMNIKELEWHFDLPFWNKAEGRYNLTPNEVLISPEIYSKEFERTMNSDLSYPLDIMYWKNRWLMLDGLHRLVKAKQLGLETVKVRKVSTSLIPYISK